MTFETSILDQGVSAYLAAQEAQVPDLKSGVEKRVLWAGEPEVQTDQVLLYIHGFSATSEEIRPVPDEVAQAMGANLVFARLTGHGITGEALARATLDAWMQDMDEALAVARKVGKRITVMATSTGCTMTTLALAAGLGTGVERVIFVAPNFQVKQKAAVMLTWPLVEIWGPWVGGKTHGFDPVTEDQIYFGTPEYPFAALLPMAQAVKAARSVDYAALKIPALFLFDDGDEIVDSKRTRQVAKIWGADLHVVDSDGTENPTRHVIAGRLSAPSMTEQVVSKIKEWMEI